MDEFDAQIASLAEAIYEKYQEDFRQYNASFLRRRVSQVMELFSCSTPAQLEHRVLSDTAIFGRFLSYLTVQVSDMFRDPSYFAALRAEVVPVLATYSSFKIWVAGCGCGEEVWSLAVLLEEEGLLDRCVIYATDIHPRAIEAAERGIYDLSRVAGFSRNYQQSGGKRSLSDYYTVAYGNVILRERLKRKITFATHSLATDEVFSEVHLVSCRNVLIYFNRTLQNRAVGLFSSGLVHKGFLGLGAKESLYLTQYKDDFKELPGGHRIYQLHRA